MYDFDNYDIFSCTNFTVRANFQFENSVLIFRPENFEAFSYKNQEYTIW